MEPTAIVKEVWVAASPARTWSALTEKEEMKAWYFDLEAFEPREGFEFQFSGGKEGRTYLHRCRVTEVVPQRTLAYTWAYEGFSGTSLVRFDLEPREGGTLVRLTHSGLESFAGQHPDLHPDNFTEGWTYIIGTALKNYLG